MPQIGDIKYGEDLGYKSLKVKYTWLSCESCGKERWVTVRNRTHMCRDCQLKWLHSQMGRKNPSWKGGRIKHGSYIKVMLQPDDFFYPVADHSGYAYEHRLVMAKCLGRCLLPWEIVHHKNGLKNDNRIENLELLPSPKSHLVDSLTKGRIKKLEKEITLLKERIKKLEKL